MKSFWTIKRRTGNMDVMSPALSVLIYICIFAYAYTGMSCKIYIRLLYGIVKYIMSVDQALSLSYVSTVLCKSDNFTVYRYVGDMFFFVCIAH